MNLKIEDILKCTEGKLIIGNKNAECSNYSKDTRTIKQGDTYIGIKGENFDGSLFWEEAFNNGADTVIINEIVIESKNIIIDNNKVYIMFINNIKRIIYVKFLFMAGTMDKSFIIS